MLFAFHELVSRHYFIIVPSNILQDTVPFLLDRIKITFMLVPVLPVDQEVDTCINFNRWRLVMCSGCMGLTGIGGTTSG